MLGSTIYTIGTALTRAQDRGIPVEVLVDGHWILGDVSAVDGHGVVLNCADGALAMLRVEKIDAVLVRQTDAFEGREAAEPDEAHPMPARVTDHQAAEPRLVRPRSSIEGHWSQGSSGR